MEPKRLSNDRVFTSRYVYKLKRSAITGEVYRFKARLIVRGFQMEKGVDFDDSFSPTPGLAVGRFMIRTWQMYLRIWRIFLAYVGVCDDAAGAWGGLDECAGGAGGGQRAGSGKLAVGVCDDGPGSLCGAAWNQGLQLRQSSGGNQ
jgi:hypothetical protein